MFFFSETNIHEMYKNKFTTIKWAAAYLRTLFVPIPGPFGKGVVRKGRRIKRLARRALKAVDKSKQVSAANELAEVIQAVDEGVQVNHPVEVNQHVEVNQPVEVEIVSCIYPALKKVCTTKATQPFTFVR